MALLTGPTADPALDRPAGWWRPAKGSAEGWGGLLQAARCIQRCFQGFVGAPEAGCVLRHELRPLAKAEAGLLAAKQGEGIKGRCMPSGHFATILPGA